uniref:Serine-threonine/tyrosine-protein kinase catalytic domain-containing protein n=1 Tax=Quercus lobata TaxID=97700 RepID=A0A7N2M8K9_QUELO
MYTDGFVIPSLEIGDLDRSKTDVSEVEASKPPCPKQDPNSAGRKQRFKQKLKEADERTSGTGRENKLESLRELVGGGKATGNMTKGSTRDWLDPHCHESQFEKWNPHIFLDEHDVPKLSHFHFSVSIPEGEADVDAPFRSIFCAPEFEATGKATEKADVYAFGRILLELLTGEDSLNITRFTIDKDSTLVAYLHNRAQGSCINEIMDPAILAEDGDGGASLQHQLQAVVDLGLTCTEEDPQRRPTMVDVTKQLRRIERFTQTGEELGGNLQNLKLLESVEEHASASLKRNASSDEIQAVNKASERPLEV